MMSCRAVVLLVGMILMFSSPLAADADSVVINPSDDGSIYTGSICDGCNPVVNSLYVTAAGSIQGVIKFPIDLISGSISSALLSVNPYGLPLFDTSVDVYGFTDNTGFLAASDAHAGTFLGTWNLPELNSGQDAFFDVTNFLNSANTAYVGFNLRTNDGIGADVFSSLEYNYGHPSNLLVTSVPVPEPVSAVLMLLGGGVMSLSRKYYQANRLFRGRQKWS